MKRLQFSFTQESRRNQWVEFPLTQREREASVLGCTITQVLGMEYRIGYCNCPESAGSAAYIGGSDEEVDNIRHSSYDKTNQVRYIVALYQWAMVNRNMFTVTWRNEDVTTRDGWNSKFYDTPMIACPTCGKFNCPDAFVGSGSHILCTHCAGTLKVCTLCGSSYHSKFCTNCYTEGVCAYCDEEGIHLNSSRAILCSKHLNVTLVPERSYSWKPDTYSYHSMAHVA